MAKRKRLTEEQKRRRKAKYEKMRRRRMGILTPRQTAWKRFGRKRKSTAKKKPYPHVRCMITLARKMRRTQVALTATDMAFHIAQALDRPEFTPTTINRLCKRVYQLTDGQVYMLKLLLDGEYYYVAI